MKITTHLFLIALLLFTFSPTLVSAEETEQPKQKQTSTETSRIHMLLTAYHKTPAKSMFEEASPKARMHLHNIVKNTKIFPNMRYRALDALGAYWPDAEALTLYRQLAQDPKSEEGMLHRVLMLGARHFKNPFIKTIIPFLQHKDAQLRMTAVEALALISDKDANAALRLALKTEKAEWIQERIRGALTVVR